MAGKPLLPKIEALEARVAALEDRKESVKASDLPALPLAVVALMECIERDEATYRRYLALARRLQGTTDGLLSDVVKSIRQQVDASMAQEKHPAEAGRFFYSEKH